MMLYPEKFPVPLVELTETDSTNCFLGRYCDTQKAEEFTTAIAEHQTSGKGQTGNVWESETGKNITCSTVLYPHFIKPQRQFTLSQIISLSIKEALDEWTDGISIKWPNDIYWKEKKICGILIENDLTGDSISRCIIGIGVNINQQTFHSNAPNPVSLFQITGAEHDKYTILSDILQRMKAYYSLLKRSISIGATDVTKQIADRYAQALFRKEGLHRYADKEGEFTARIKRVEPDGRLILEDSMHKERNYLFKEVKYLI